eukprot:c23782_g1_i3 orf=135-1181(+)
MEDCRPVTVEVKQLNFTYPGIDGYPAPGAKPLIQDFSITLRAGDRCLLVGVNGAGKSTVLRIIGGQHMVEPGAVRVLGKPVFHDTTLTSSGELSYLGGEWKRDVAFAGFDVPLQMDVSAEKMIFGVQGINAERRSRLIRILDIDLSWRLHKVSDGQRRRVQICMGLLQPFKVLLLDEITVDLDVLARADLLSFLRSESEERGATIIYATHIFDGLDSWPSHIVLVDLLVTIDSLQWNMLQQVGPSWLHCLQQAHIGRGRLQFARRLEDIEDIKKSSLMRAVEMWLRKEIEEQRMLRKEAQTKCMEQAVEHPARVVVQLVNNGWVGGRLHSTIAGEDPFGLSSNRVLRP